MRNLSICLALALGLVPGAALADDAAVMAPISTFIDSFNSGETEAALATMTSDVAIVDEVAPYHWVGAADWMAALGNESADDGKTEQSVTLEQPTRFEVSGDHAYVIVPATYRFKVKDTAMEEVSQMTFALTQSSGAWKIAAWTWTGPAATPTD